jgi:diacylglycerol kinase family enzyme
VLAEIEGNFKDGFLSDGEIYVSKTPRDAIAAVHDYVKGVAPQDTVRVYAVGGDGIMFDCLNGMVDFPNAELTNIPYGSANDFVRSFGEDTKPAFRDIKKLATAPSRPVDIMHCGANYAMLEVNIGVVGMTTISANKLLRSTSSDWIRKNTSNVYNLFGAKTLFDKKVLNQHYNLQMDGRDMSGIYANIHVANIPCDGGKFVPSPHSVPDDGELEAIFLHSNSSFELVRIIGDRNNGMFEKHKTFSTHKCRTMTVQSDLPLCIQLDGEGFFAREIKIRIIPKGIKFCAPEGLTFADYSHLAYSKNKRGKGK